MISGASEEELIIANARAEVLTKCGKNVLDILDNQNEEYERKLENEVKYQNSEVIRLNNIIFTAIERLQDYDLVENKQKVIDDVFDILRGDNEGESECQEFQK
jgi:hypothetical protein